MLQVPKSYQNTVKHELRNAYRLVTDCLYMTIAESKGFGKVFLSGEVPKAMCTVPVLPAAQSTTSQHTEVTFTHCTVQVSRQKHPACNCNIDPKATFYDKSRTTWEAGKAGISDPQHGEGLAHVFSQAETGREPAPTGALWFLTELSSLWPCLSLDYQACFTVY